MAPVEAIPEEEQEQAAAEESGLQNEAATALALEVPTAEPAASGGVGGTQLWAP